MKLWLSEYQLTVRVSGRRRQGYLLKVQTDSFEAGYADIFPWPEFGDPEVHDIPRMLSQEVQSPLLKRSLEMAFKDGQAREANQPLFNSDDKVKNHFLINEVSEFTEKNVEDALSSGFDKIKLKVGRNEKREIELLWNLSSLKKDSHWIRLDCNTKGSHRFFEKLRSLSDSIEYIEDPFPTPQQWTSSLFPWAYDQPGFPADQVDVKWQIVKPAKQRPVSAVKENRIFTSYLDHPVGMAHAFCEALRYGKPKQVYGLMSHQVYQTTPYHEWVQSQGPWLSFRDGKGVGFDELLAAQEWRRL